MKKPTKPITEVIIGFNPRTEGRDETAGRFYGVEVFINPDNFDDDKEFFAHISKVRKSLDELYTLLEGEHPDDISFDFELHRLQEVQRRWKLA